MVCSLFILSHILSKVIQSLSICFRKIFKKIMSSDITLNLQLPSPQPRQNKPIQKPKIIQNESGKDGPRKPSGIGKKRKYIDPKDFVPISSLFEKNPEIPTVDTENEVSSNTVDVSFSANAFKTLPINNKLKGNLTDQFHIDSLTKIQSLSLPALLKGKDVMVKSPTGSGKTMCYAIPIVEKLSVYDPPINRSDGPYAVVLVPTRELALQIFNIFQDLCKSSINVVPGLLVGGEKCKAEKARIRKGINILISTPGRLAYHMKETASLVLKNLQFLVLDEVDRLLDMGFLASVSDIIKQLDERSSNTRQTIILSATLNSSIKALSKLSMSEPLIVDDAMEETESKKQKVDSYTLPESLSQTYVFVPSKLRMVSLFAFIASKSFLSKSQKNKIIVFIANKASVQFYEKAFKMVLKEKFNMDKKSCERVFQLQGSLNQKERFETYKKFQLIKSGVLFCTDVAARGLDIKNVDWIIQFSCPHEIEDYCHKVGRTARIGMQGNSLLFLQPSEKEYLDQLSSKSIALKETTLDDLLTESLSDVFTKKMTKEDKATELQNCVEEALVKDTSTHKMASAAYFSFIQSYSTYPSAMKGIFHPKKLHLGHTAKSFGLREAPGKLKEDPKKIKLAKEKEKSMEKKKYKRLNIPADDIYSGPRTKKYSKKKSAGGKKKIRI